jgi:predicted cytidylate kinase
MKITLSGKAGAGKSSVGKILAQKLDFEFISIGNWTREYALKNYNMNINQFQEYCSLHPEVDKLIDIKMSENCNLKDNIIIDYRLGFHFIKNSLNIYLNVSDAIAFERINIANRINEDITKDDIDKRNQEMCFRFIKTYGVDINNLKNYDLVINTDQLTPEQIVKKIIVKLNDLK